MPDEATVSVHEVQVSESKENDDMGFTNPALPVTVPAIGATGYSGFNPSDAALVHSNQTGLGAMFNFGAARDAERENIETRHQLERAVKDSQIESLRQAAEIKKEIQDIRRELQAKVEAESTKTAFMVTSAVQSAASQLQSTALTGSAVELLMRQLIPKVIAG